MKKIFKKLGFRKSDEMDISIQLKSIKFAWGYTVIVLIIWMFYDFYKLGNMGMPLILLVSQNIILLVLQIYFKNKMITDGKENDDEE